MVDTVRSPVSEIGFQSQLPALLDLSKYIGGSKTSGAAGETAVTTGETAPLEALLAQVSDPNNLLALVQSLFAQGAAQVPGLSTAYAGATGTRTSNNSMLGLSLAQLNQSLAQSIANAVVSQQANVALPAAAGIAKANTTQTGAKTSTQTVRPGVSPIASIGGGLLLGSAANKIGKKLFPADEPVVTPSPSIAVPEQLSGPGSGYEPPAIDVIPTATTFESTSPSFLDAGVAGSTLDFENASMVGAASDVTDFVPDLSGITDFTDFFGFADGGRVGGKWKQRKIDTEGSYADGGEVLQGKPATPKNAVVSPSLDVISKLLDLWQSSISTHYPEPSKAEGGKGGKGGRGYADGGAVVRNVPQFGAATPQVATPAAALMPLLLAALAPQAPAAGKKKGAGESAVQEGGGDSTSASSATGSPSAATSGALGSGVGLGAGLAGVAGAMGPGGLAAGIAAGIAAAAKGAAMTAIASALTGADDLSGTVAASAPDAVGVADLAAGGMTSGFSAASPAGISAGLDEGSGYAGDLAGGFGATSDTSGFGGTAGDTGAGDTGGSGDAGGGDTGGGGDSGGGWSDGGNIPGVSGRSMPPRGERSRKNPPSGGVRGGTEGVDSVAIAAMPGEYMLPVDVVDYIGRDELDALVAAIHAPLKNGTHG